MNTLVSARRRTIDSRVVLDYAGNYNITDDVTVTNNQRINGGLDWFVTARFLRAAGRRRVLQRSVSELRSPVDSSAGAVGYQMAGHVARSSNSRGAGVSAHDSSTEQYGTE